MPKVTDHGSPTAAPDPSKAQMTAPASEGAGRMTTPAAEPGPNSRMIAMKAAAERWAAKKQT
jgi:hypothetical protein